jgi:NOL1/NOP2/sun family putative RNA methylase
MPRESKHPEELPPIFLARMQALLGADYPAFLQSFTEQPHTGLRVNTLNLSAEQFQALTPFPLASIPWCPDGFLVSPDSQPGKHPYHAAGLYYLQEPSAMAAAEILAPLPGERVLDLSAAPGGKSTHLAALMQNQGLLVANEIHPTRVWDLAENLERCGVQIATISNETPEHLIAHFGPFFDRVLLDAPCSGEGMFRKSEVARAQWSLEHVRSCAQRQQAILQAASGMLKPGGTLVYSTCTFAPEENEAVIGRFLLDNPDYALSQPPERPSFSPGIPSWTPQSQHLPLERTVRIWPHQSIGEGHFIARLQRLPGSVPIASKSPGVVKTTLPPHLARQFQDFLAGTLTDIKFNPALSLFGSYLYQLPRGLPELGHLKTIHPGWWLGVYKKDRFEPSHALALGLKAAQVQRSHSLFSGDPALLAYLRGESLPSSGEDGWTLVTVDGFSIGWGKRVHHILKNAYPHGLRQR